MLPLRNDGFNYPRVGGRLNAHGPATQNKPGDWGLCVIFASAKASGPLAAVNPLNLNHRND